MIIQSTENTCSKKLFGITNTETSTSTTCQKMEEYFQSHKITGDSSTIKAILVSQHSV